MRDALHLITADLHARTPMRNQFRDNDERVTRGRSACAAADQPRADIARLVLAGAMIFAGLSHLFWAREEFQAQVPKWVPMDADGVVMASVVSRSRSAWVSRC